MLPRILRMIVPAVSGEFASSRHPRGRNPLPGARRGTRRASTPSPAVRRDSCIVVDGRDGSVQAGPQDHSGVARRAACHPWTRRWMRRSRGSVVTARGTTNCSRSPAAPPAGSSRGRTRVLRYSPVRYVTVCNRPRPYGGATFAERRVGPTATMFSGRTSPPGGHSGAEHAAARGVLREPRRFGVGEGLGRAARPPPASGGPPSPSRNPRARDTTPRCGAMPTVS